MTYEIMVEMNLEKIIAESREVSQALNEFADKLEQIKKKYAEPKESKKVNCKSTKCENCINHNYCDYEPQESGTEKHKPCINYEDGCEEWAGCPCVHYKAESEDKE